MPTQSADGPKKIKFGVKTFLKDQIGKKRHFPIIGCGSNSVLIKSSILKNLKRPVGFFFQKLGQTSIS